MQENCGGKGWILWWLKAAPNFDIRYKKCELLKSVFKYITHIKDHFILLKLEKTKVFDISKLFLFFKDKVQSFEYSETTILWVMYLLLCSYY